MELTNEQLKEKEKEILQQIRYLQEDLVIIRFILKTDGEKKIIIERLSQLLFTGGRKCSGETFQRK